MVPIGLWFIHLKWVPLQTFEAFAPNFGIKLSQKGNLHVIVKFYYVSTSSSNGRGPTHIGGHYTTHLTLASLV